MIRIPLLLGAMLTVAACASASTDRAPAATAATSESTIVTTTTSVAELPMRVTTMVPPSPTTLAPSPGYPVPTAGSVDRWRPEVRAEYPHDAGAFTQGLVMVDGRLFESTGRYGRSTIRQVELATGDVIASVSLAEELFGEGLAYVDGRLFQLTFQEEVAIVWLPSLAEAARFTYSGQGWGLCDDGTRLVMSDGSSTLQFRDRATFELTGSVDVTLDGNPVERLNELECVDGLVFANVWMTSDIVVIDPVEGDVTAVVDAAALDEWSADDPAAVSNGIAYSDERGVFYLTGKLWPVLYEVVLVEE